MCTVYKTIDKGIPLPGDTQRNLTPEFRQLPKGVLHCSASCSAVLRLSSRRTKNRSNMKDKHANVHTSAVTHKYTIILAESVQTQFQNNHKPSIWARFIHVYTTYSFMVSWGMVYGIVLPTQTIKPLV